MQPNLSNRRRLSGLLQIAEVLKVGATEFMRRIEEEMKRGPQELEKIEGEPRKNAVGK